MAVVGTSIVKFIAHSSPGARVILESESVIHVDSSWSGYTSSDLRTMLGTQLGPFDWKSDFVVGSVTVSGPLFRILAGRVIDSHGSSSSSYRIGVTV